MMLDLVGIRGLYLAAGAYELAVAKVEASA